MSRLWIGALLALSPLMSSCSVQLEGDNSTYASVMNEILKSRVDILAGSTLFYGIVGAVIGAVLGVILFFGVRAVGGFKLEWVHAKWLRVLTFLIYLGGCATLAGGLGALHGSKKGMESVVVEGHLGKEVFPTVASTSAQFLYTMDLSLNMTPADLLATGPDMTLVQGFATGQSRFEAKAFFARIALLKAELKPAIVNAGLDNFHKLFPDHVGTHTEELVVYLLETLADKVIEKATGKIPAEDKLLPLLDGIEEAANGSEAPGSLSHDELAAVVTDKGLVPWTLEPIHNFIGGKQKTLAIILVLLLLLPVVAFRTADHFYEKNKAES